MILKDWLTRQLRMPRRLALAQHHDGRIPQGPVPVIATGFDYLLLAQYETPAKDPSGNDDMTI
jgi:hypothetical protein